MLNDGAIKQFIHDVGVEAAQRLADLFIQEAEDNIAAIAGHLPDPADGEVLVRLAHSLKSTSRTYGLAELGDMADDMEQAGRANDFDTYQAIFNNLSAKAPEHFAALRDAYQC